MNSFVLQKMSQYLSVESLWPRRLKAHGDALLAPARAFFLSAFVVAAAPVWAASDMAEEVFNEAVGHELYRSGLYPEAIAHWQKAAALGDAGAAFRLGEEYFDAKVVDRDLDRVFKYWTQAAEGQDPRGITDLAGLYDYGNGVRRDRKRAAELYAVAAEMGFPAAMFNIAAMLEVGEEMEKDTVEAYKFYILAGRNGFAPFTSPALELLRKSMSAEEVEEAERRARDFKAKK